MGETTDPLLTPHLLEEYGSKMHKKKSAEEKISR
jgi:hypothetical protein